MAATLKTQISDIEKLKSSRGWSRLEKKMREEITTAAMQIANTPNMTEKEIDFRRGAIWAATQLVELPDRLLMQLRNEHALEDAVRDGVKIEDTVTIED